ncbi:MAG: helix-turn-helix domain-containing protein [Deltaproteobacteria bacterium]|nr:helix-turn-helix domain-containing protein [Deltaproteobacteria bacterium]
MSAADWIRSGRSAKKLSQAELGKLVGTHQVRVSQWENGKASPSADETRRLVEVLGPDGQGGDVSVLAPPPVAPAPKRKPRGGNKPAAHEQTGPSVLDYRHDAKRKNIPPAGLAAQGKVKEARKIEYAYNPHLPPVLRFDPTAGPDKLPQLLEAARTRALTAEEAQTLTQALRHQEPWLEWAGKREKKGFAVDPVALHIHERVATQAILKVAAREDVQRDLFADPKLDYAKAVQFYQHDVDWANRMILGDSLQVMASLAHREGLAGKVQMIYMDPPYGIKFASNFQPEIGKRDVKEKEQDLTREPEMVKAYRDTWTLGVHSYLAYLRDRLVLCRELLTDTGSIFVQISDENLHRLRCVLDEVFGSQNLVSLITFKKTSGAGSFAGGTNVLAATNDYLIWYAKDMERVKYHQVFRSKEVGGAGGGAYTWIEDPDGCRARATNGDQEPPHGARVFRADNLTSQTVRTAQTTVFDVTVDGVTYRPGKGGWKTNVPGMARLVLARRLLGLGNTLSYVRYFDDFPAFALTNLWDDTTTAGFADAKIYVVQTNAKVIERCLLMTTDPGDLVLDPTCGSGTTAHVAEQWGRRWVTIDTSRVALALARQRLLTATFPFHKVQEGGDGTDPSRGFVYKTVPHITLKSIAQNTALDLIFVRHQPILAERLAALNRALTAASPDVRRRLQTKLLDKEKREGKRAITDADRRRWELPKEAWKEWEVPFDTDGEWPEALRTALNDYRAAWRAKMDEVNACIMANAEQEELVDQPEAVKGVVRVSGPFTMEAVMPPEESLSAETPIGGEPEELETFAGSGVDPVHGGEAVNAEAYLDRMIGLLRGDGVRFPNNKAMTFVRLEASPGSEYLHAEGEWKAAGEDCDPRTVAVSFGPQFGPVTAYHVENALPVASRRGFEDVVFAGFSFDAAAQAILQEDPNPRVRCHLAHIRPDVNMGELLKETAGSQLFTVFGLPRTTLREVKDGQFTIEMQGVDIYNPVGNTILPTGASKVAAWFLDADYDGRTFCITQAFFPDKTAWQKLARSLKGVVDEGAFDALSGTTSLAFPAGRHKRAAVKVIDPRGNEAMRVHRLDGKPGYE